MKGAKFAVLGLSLLAVIGLSACVGSSDSSKLDTVELLAGQIMVNNQTAFEQAIDNVKAGQTIILADGVWTDFEMLVRGKGTKDAPITVRAQTEGKVVLSGLSSLSLHGEHLVVSGLIFKDGYSPTGAVISFREEEGKVANYSRVTRTVIDNFSNPDKFSSDYWVALYGKHNRFDHNHLEGKSNAGVTMAVRLTSAENQENYHRIDHNYFGPRPILGSNGGETLRIGTSKYSLTDSFTTVENNYFDRANGEVEIISNKSGKNIFRNNTFFESRGTLTLRHGNGNLVEGNVFLGNGKDHTGGIRVINADQTIRNNYMEGLTGIRFGGGFVVLNGVPNSKINRYHRVKNTTIENNTLVNLSNINLAAGSDAERTAVPIDSTFKNNLVVNEQNHPFKIFDDISGIKFSNNLSNQDLPDELAYGFDKKDISVERAQTGLLVNANAAANGVGASLTLRPIDKNKTGVSWYPKNTKTIEFSSGSQILVNNANDLVKAVANANAGDLIKLAPGEYGMLKPIVVKTTVTIMGSDDQASVIYPMRTLFAEISDGGSLKLENLVIDGEKAPDAAGNVLVRNTRIPTLKNYRLSFDSVLVKNLNVNHSAHVFDAGYRSMADSITISNSVFENITGDILRLNKEQDDLGIYNVEYLTIVNSQFKDIQGAVAKIYRGGTDESTFGPHVYIHNSRFENIGKGKRNKHRASLYLHGVQDTDLLDNQFLDLLPVVIEHTVGEPQTLIENNVFANTSLPKVTEVFTKGESTAVLKNNTVKGSN